jgi:hypothetical protein
MVKWLLVATQRVVQASRVIAFASGESVPRSSAQCVDLPVLVPSRCGEQDTKCLSRRLHAHEP